MFVIKRQVYEYLVEQFCFDRYYFEDVCLEMPDGFLKTRKRYFDLIIFNPKKILFFTEIPEKAGQEDIYHFLRAGLNCLCSKLSVSLHQVVACGIGNDEIFILNKYNDQVKSFDFSADGIKSFFECVHNEFSFGPVVFFCQDMAVFRDILFFSGGSTKSGQNTGNFMQSADGTMYIRKHGSWKEASEFDPETLFLSAVFGGFFGAHLFYQGKRIKGIFYLLSFGCLGFGWFFDCIEILLGVYRDPDGRYVAPLQSKLLGLLIFGAGLVFVFLLGKLFLFCTQSFLSVI